MTRHGIFLCSMVLFVSGAAQAAPVSAISDLSMSHSFVINSGQSPTGIDIANLSSTLVIESDVASAVDDPGFTNSTGSSFQVGNPFADPPLL